MDRLGYARFCVQGGDTGAFIAPEMGRQAPERVIGIHLNALLTFPSGEEGEREALTEEEQKRLERMEGTMMDICKFNPRALIPSHTACMIRLSASWHGSLNTSRS